MKINSPRATRVFLLVLVCLTISFSSVQTFAQKTNLDKVCVSKEEMKLYELINEYRKTKGLPSIPLSRSLTFVAQTHVRDLAANHPDKGSCNLHSWSDKGTWTACCYTPDHKQALCMWNKPKELTKYPGQGFEIAFMSTGNLTAESALNGWENSSHHNAVMTNTDIWKTSKWNAIGVAIYNGYSVVWFGREADAETVVPIECAE